MHRTTAAARQIAAGQALDLLSGDQCGAEMRRGAIFHGLAEGPVTFLPTYKFEKGRESNALQPFYDQGEKKRVPAWTDRVLFRGSAPQRSSLAPNATADAADVRVRPRAGGGAAVTCVVCVRCICGGRCCLCWLAHALTSCCVRRPLWTPLQTPDNRRGCRGRAATAA